jgi:phytoene/squalene synthetase
VLYAFCRLADDLVDEAPDPTIARVEVGRLRAELRGEQEARPLVAEVRALLRPSGCCLRSICSTGSKGIWTSRFRPTTTRSTGTAIRWPAPWG